MNLLSLFCVCSALVFVLSSGQDAELSHPIANKACSQDKDCWDQSLLAETQEESLHPIPQLLCINSTCQCDSATSVLAAVRVSYTATHAGNPDFIGYSFLYPGNKTLCAPKMGQTCAGRGYCAPGSYCVYHSVFSEKGTCRCNPGTRYSNVTGLCECRQGQKLNNDGVCAGPSLNASCSDANPCGIDNVSKLDLACNQGVCQCNASISVLASVRSGHAAVHAGDPEFKGFGPFFTESGDICTPKAGESCVGRGHCAPGSYCVYHRPDSWKGVCRCIPGTRFNNGTGLCECRGGQTFDAEGNCAGDSMNNTCVDHDGCGIDTVSRADLVCLQGTCQCNSSVSVLAVVRTSDTKVHADYPEFRGYHKQIPESGSICAPKAGQRCAGRGYCAPGAYCVYQSRDTWQGMCTCIPGSKYNNATGLCDCKPGQELNEDGFCSGASINETCTDSAACGIDPDSNLELVCLGGKCQCDPGISVFSTVGTSHISVHSGNPDYMGYLHFIDNQTLCAPKAQQSCAGRGYCAPKSYCVYKSPRSWLGSCKCIPNSEVSPTTGLCECKAGYYYHGEDQHCRPNNFTEVNSAINEVGISPAAEAATANKSSGDGNSERAVGQTLGFVLLGIALTIAIVGGAFVLVRKYFYQNGVLMPLQFPLRRSGTQLL